MKYMKSILIFTLLVLALFSIACVSAVDVNDTLAASGDNQIINDEPVGQSNDLVSDDAYNASLSGDEIIGVNLEDDKDILGVDPGFYMLDALIKDTKEGETLKLKSDFKYGLLVDPQLKKIEINKAITIDGGNGRHIIDADNEVMIFEINCNDVTLQNIHFKNSKYAAINCTKNVSSITIKECTFENTVGCAVWFSGDAYNCKIEGCEFKKNDPKSSTYSSVNFKGKATMCSIKSNAFTDNKAVYGSALQFWGDVEKCNISNSVTGKDGAYSEVGGAVTFVGKVSDTIIGGYFKKNAAKYGGAIYFGSEVSNSVINANFDENTVSGNATDDEAAGGAIMFNSTVSDTTINGKFTNNKALGNDGWAGAICFLAPVNNIKVYGEFTSNTASKSGGALYFIEDLQNSIISANFGSNKAYGGAGGAILINKTDNTSFSGFFQSNSASAHGGAIYSYDVMSNSNISARFEQNRANNGDGGAIYAFYLSHINITGLFNANRANYGGAVYCTSIIDSTISAKFNSNSVKASGGAINIDIISRTDIFGEFSENRATVLGGAIFSGSILNSAISAKFIGNRISGNSGVGAAIYSIVARDSIFSNCDFIGNYAKGGIVYIESVPYVCLNLILNNNTFLNNNNSKIYFNALDYSNVNFNWFGSNASNYDIRPIESNFVFTDWLFLNATLDYSSFLSSNTVDVLFKLYRYNRFSGKISEYDNDQFKHLNFTITSSNGKVNKSIVKLGETVKFTPDNKKPGFVTAKIENAYYTIKIGVKGDFDALQELIDNSTSPVINLERSYDYNLFDRMTEGIVINKPVTINGNGFAIDAKGKSRIFNITCDNVEIKNITFLNANSEGRGGAVLINASNVSVSNCIFMDNSAGEGVVYFDTADGIHSNLKINNNIFLDNGVCEISFDEIDSNSNVDYNWFGNNATNYDVQPKTTNINLNNWLFLNATSNSSSITAFESPNVLFKLFLYNLTSQRILDYDNSEFENLDLKITAIKGNVDRNIAKFGENIKFTPTRGGNASVTAKIMDSYVTIEFYVIKGDFDRLQDLIDDATSLVINLTRNYTYNEFDSITEGIIINIPVIINGNGFVIDAKGKSRVFNVQATDVIIENLTIKNAKFNGDGGAVYFAQSGMAINCNFTDNKVTGDYSQGGAVYFYGDGNVTNCNFTDNTAKFGGAVYFNSNGDVTNCNFTNNSATSEGGAIRFNSEGTVTNCNFTNNSATAHGGAVYFLNNGEVTHCNFNNNTANSGGFGGAVYFYGDGTVTNCNFTDNTANSGGGAVYFLNKGEVLNCNFNNNIAEAFGGAIYFAGDSTGEVLNCNFTDNTANYDGGAIYFAVGSNREVLNCNFTDNTAKHGGAIYFAVGSTGEVLNCNFTDNTANFDGGAIYFAGDSTGEVLNCNFTDNTANYGGAVYFLKNGEVLNCNFTNNTANYDGGAIYFAGGSTGEVLNCNFNNNSANSDGGAVYFNNNGEVLNCNFNNNSANSDGGAVYFNSNGDVRNCNFNNNSANSDGGAVYFNNFKSNGDVRNCNFTNNSANRSGFGGAIWISYGTVENCNFINNSARYGGAIYFFEGGNVIKCNFTNNQAARAGAIIFEDYSTGNVINCNFTNNQLDGAIYFGGSGFVTNCSFTDNTATFGGAIEFSGFGSGFVTNCSFTDNKANFGSAIYFNKYNSADNTLTISNSILLNNRANDKTLDVVKNDNNITITFTGQNNLLNAIYSEGDVNFTNVTYWGANGKTNSGNSTIELFQSNKEAGQNITIAVIVNDKLVFNDVKVTDENGTIVLDINAGENYYITARHNTDSYYTEAEKTISNMTFTVSVTSQTTTNKTVNITAKSNIKPEVMPGKLLFILPNCTEINATCASDGTWWAVHTFDSIGDYEVNASYIGLDGVNINNATITINLIEANVSVDQSAINLFVGENATVHATATPDGLKVNFSTNDYDIISVDKDGNIIALGEGNATITVSVGDNVVYTYDSVTVNVTVAKVPTEIKITNKTLDLKVTEEIDVGASLNPKDAPVDELIYTSGDENVVKIKNSKIIAVGEGSTVVTVSFKGNNKYAAAENKTIKVSVGLNDASVNVSKNVYYMHVGDNATIHATATPGSLKVNFSTDDYDIVSVDMDGNIMALGEGNATITVSVGDNIVYKYDSVTVNVTVTKIPVEIKIANETLNLKVKGIADSAASLIPSDAGNPTYISSNESVVIINNGQIVAVGEGTATVTVSFAGNEKYLAAKNKTITVNVEGALKDASVSVDASSVDLKVGENYTIYATTTPDNLNVTYKSSDESVITVDNGFIVAVGEGNATVTVIVGDNEEYALNSTVVNVTVSKIQTEIIIANKTLDLKVNEEVDVGASLNPKNAPAGELVYESSDESIVKVENAKIIALKQGIAVVNVSFKGNNKYAAALNKTIKVSVGLNDASV
uniref:right-handed parallel beta-helix repeat-containing protein n=1 Tax=uncultured Methanobrevibacter sp. TaxID=253161 RepID=UPI0025FE6CA1